jgi:hypothetical protein
MKLTEANRVWEAQSYLDGTFRLGRSTTIIGAYTKMFYEVSSSFTASTR